MSKAMKTISLATKIQQYIEKIFLILEEDSQELTIEAVMNYFSYGNEKVDAILFNGTETSVEKEAIRDMIIAKLLSNYYLFHMHQEDIATLLETTVEDEIMEELEDENKGYRDYIEWIQEDSQHSNFYNLLSSNLECSKEHYIQWNYQYHNAISRNTYRTIFRINPFEITSFLTLPPKEYYTSSETIISELVDSYKSFCEENGIEEEEELSQEQFIEFRKYLYEINVYLYSGNQLQINRVYLYYISEFYEYILTQELEILDEETLAVIRAIKGDSKEELLKQIYKNKFFFATVISSLISLTYEPIFGENTLKNFRKNSKQTKEFIKVKSLNPFYREEERKWQDRL